MSTRTRTDAVVNLGRRAFLRTGLAAGAGLTLGVALPGLAGAASYPNTVAPGTAPGTGAFEPNAFLRIDTDDTVTVIIKHLEMGQGTYTGLSTLVAEELDAAWSQVVPEGAPADPKRYANLFWSGRQGTGGSTAMANSFTQMRRAGAVARAMLVGAAAERWGVPAAEIEIRAGVVRHAASGRQARFGELAEAAARQPVPETVFLKDPDEFVLIGTELPRLDNREKVDGSAVFTQDIALPGMLTAVVARPPRFGARVKSFDAADAEAVDGVAAVVAIPGGVAVLGRDFWSAHKGREALRVQWDESEAFHGSSDALMADYRARAEQPGAVAAEAGDVARALDGAARRVEAGYEFPFLAHAAMEPLNCVVQIHDDGCEIWNGEQGQTTDQRHVAEELGIDPMDVRIHMLYAGGAFGRRANPHSDYVLEAVRIAKAHGQGVPIKMLWTREDDTKAGYYRPMYFHRLRGAVDGEGRPVAWEQRIVGQSVFAAAGRATGGIDPTSVEGASDMPYAIPHRRVDLHTTEVNVPIQWWRSVGHTHTAFAVECFVDELAHAAGADPVAFRRGLLADHPAWRRVLDLAVEHSDWGRPLTPGRGRGVAVHKSFNTLCAQVAEVSVADDGDISVERVVVAVDCGLAVNPDIVRAQMEGGVAYGLSAALHGAITLKNGRVQQSNFSGYPIVTLDRMPRVEVHIVPSTDPPTGVGEPGVPPIAPAVANAVFAASGQRLRRLPLALG